MGELEARDWGLLIRRRVNSIQAGTSEEREKGRLALDQPPESETREWHRLQSVILCVITQTEVCATLPRLPFQLGLTKSLAVLERGDERLDHFSIDVVPAKLIQLVEPEVIAAQVCIR